MPLTTGRISSKSRFAVGVNSARSVARHFANKSVAMSNGPPGSEDRADLFKRSRLAQFLTFDCSARRVPHFDRLKWALVGVRRQPHRRPAAMASSSNS